LRELPSRAVDGVVETDYFTVLARIGLASPTVLLEALASVASEGLEKQLDWLLEEWFGHVENIGDGPGKKLMTLVLTRLLETGQSWALERLQSFMALWTDVLGELLDGMDDRSVEYVPALLSPSSILFLFIYSFNEPSTDVTTVVFTGPPSHTTPQSPRPQRMSESVTCSTRIRCIRSTSLRL